jgi:uncharacterized protein
VHPEAYPVVQRILADLGKPAREVLGDEATVKRLDPQKYTDERFGLPTVQDILKELVKPGRDPRPEWKSAAFKEGVEDLKDLRPDMVLEGVVTNVTNFGAFVDVGVHQDGLVHISMMANKFVKDPHEVVKAGDVVKVKVLEVDQQRKRIALSMRLDDSAKRVRDENAGGARRERDARPAQREQAKRRAPDPAQNSAMADAFARALKRS